MKRLIFFAVLALMLSSLALAQMKGKGGGVEQSLMQTEQELADAILKGDVSPFERTLADTFSFTAPDGGMQNKTQFLADLKSGALKMESTKNDEMKVQVYGDAAVVTYRSTDKGKYKEFDISGQYRWTDVFVKRGGRWQLVSTQGTRIMQQP
ncbi:MAG TPA: nuclear transport factor 2 family protein [Pyrinomonadaceae bacterium]|jgi:ketosteroid isomerase-like protein